MMRRHHCVPAQAGIQEKGLGSGFRGNTGGRG
jgi:hypothetical protein